MIRALNSRSNRLLPCSVAASGPTGEVVQPHARTVLVAVLVVACATSVACSGTGAAPELPTVITNPSPSQLVLPLDAYVVSPAEFAAVMNARDRLVQRCMAGQGFDVVVGQRVPGTQARNARRYGLIDLDSASQYGYQPPPPSEAERQAEESLDRSEASFDSEAKERALTGGTFTNLDGTQRVGGCLGTALAQLQATELGVDEHFVENLAGEAHAKSENDRRVRAAFDAWSECMTAKGFRYGDPWEANDDPRWAAAAGTEPAALPQSDPQVATAVADVTCKHEVNLAGVWLAVETAHQLALIEDNQQRLQTIQARRTDILRAAARAE